MLTTQQIINTMAAGGRPAFGFDLGGQPAKLTLSHRRAGRAAGDVTFAYDVADAPLVAIAEVRHVPAHELLTLRVRLLARRSCSLRISGVNILDLRGPAGGAATLRGWNGGFVYDPQTGRNEAHGRFPPREFRMWDRDLSRQPEVVLEDLRGRSSVKYLPIWFIYGAESGLWFGPEWAGSWRMGAGRSADGLGIFVQLPMLDFVMQQGEEVQLPAVSLGSYRGDIREGCLALRRTIRDEFMPKLSGQAPLPSVSCHVIGGSVPEFDPAGLAREVEVLADMGVEEMIFASVWCRHPESTPSRFPLEKIQQWFPGTPNACAYDIGNWWETCGDYTPKPTRFPRGLKAFADDLAQRSMRLGLWYDPRINILTEQYGPNSDCLVPYKHTDPKDQVWDMGLIDMGTAAGRELMYSLLERFIVEYGAGVLWHDLNTCPRVRYWDDHEQEGRRGLGELRHYQGSDAVYDALLARYPHVTLEWCGGGGSMINLGLLRRAHRIYLADYCDFGRAAPDQRNTDITRAYRTSLNWIFPAGYLSNFLAIPGGGQSAAGLHNFVTQMGSSMSFNKIVSQWGQQDCADAAAAIRVFKAIRGYLNQEFWGLFDQPDDRLGWDGWQYHDPARQSGVLMLVKRRDCTTDRQTIRPRWLERRQVRFQTLLGDAQLAAADDGYCAVMAAMASVVVYQAGGHE